MTPPAERRVETATRASGLLRIFNRAGILDVADVQVAQRVSWLAGESSEPVQLAFALVVRALRLGSVCVTVESIRADVEQSMEGDLPADLPWPESGAWLAALCDSPSVTLGDAAKGERPLRLVDGQLYLERSWEQQEDVRRSLTTRAAATPPIVDDELLDAWAATLFDGVGLDPDEPDLQRLAAERAVRSRVVVIAGGPGTGKTTTVARLLSLLALQAGQVPRISLAAPSGKAAARLQEAVLTELTTLPIDPALRSGLAKVRGVTLHKLLGLAPGKRPSANASNPLPADVVVVDETSMVSLSQMAQLLDAVRSDARLVLVGDPEQLTSIDAGAVLSDISSAVETRHIHLPHVRLTHTWRYDGVLGQLAAAVRAGEPAAVRDLLDSASEPSGPTARWIRMDDAGTITQADLASLRASILPAAKQAVQAARAGDARLALDQLKHHRVLCAHRSGPLNTEVWNRQIEKWLVEELPQYGDSEDRYPGQPLLVTRNDPDLGISNGDSGIIIDTGRGLRAALDTGSIPLLLAPAQLESVETVHALTVHKAQGSQFTAITVVLPMLGSPLLTRELLYTALTRASHHVTLVAHPAALEQAVTRRALRASGLRTRL
ncbi:MAG TPA: exodeoxyribonuclease V subunit alpha [Propionibacteriaceae bacterium]|nr:exodeoxyribonuclease V subunit alpha [Propionibacteriaceae bacterium]